MLGWALNTTGYLIYFFFEIYGCSFIFMVNYVSQHKYIVARHILGYLAVYFFLISKIVLLF